MAELPTTIREIDRIKPEVLEGRDYQVHFYGDHIAMIVGQGPDCFIPDAAEIARFLASLRDGGHQIKNIFQMPLYGGLTDKMCVIIDYEYPENIP